MTRAGLPEYDLEVPVPENIEVGLDSQIWSRWAFVHYRSGRPCGLRVGRCSALWNMTMLDLGPDGEVSIGDHCTMLDVTFATNGSVTIGDFSMIGHRVVIADGAAPCPPVSGGPPGPVPEPIVIGSNTWITAGSVILPGARIGDDAVVGTGTVVDGEVPPGATAFGNPYRVVAR